MKKILFIALSLSLVTAAQGQNIQKDIALGKKYSKMVEESMGVYDNPEMTAYIKAIGDKLTAQMDAPLFDYKYAILATPEPNAFSIPGGHLYITTGMFPFLESEDELACIMAHEIIHANNRHVIKSNRKGIVPGILQIPGAIVGAIIDENVGKAMNAPFRQIGQLTHASYNRKQEIEADLEGVEIAAKAGYDPDALKSLLKRIGKYSELVTGEAEQKNRFATHPMTDQRVKKIEKLQPSLIRGEPSPLVDAFLQMFDGVLAGSDPSRGVLAEQTFIHPTFGFKLVFPEGWESAFMGNQVVGVDQEAKEMVRLTFDVSDVIPADAAKKYTEAIGEKGKATIVKSEPVTIGKKTGYAISFKEESGGEIYYGSRIWLKHDSLILSFLTVNTTKDQAKMTGVVGSFDKLTKEDRKAIEVSRLKLVNTRQNESITAFTERTKTPSSEAFTLLINQKEDRTVFQEGETLKVVVLEKY